MYLTYGLLGGIGFGLIFLPAEASVIKTFYKRRSLASGIANCGNGIGIGLMWLPAEVCVIKNFNKRRAFACGIANCGTGLGMFAFNTLISKLIIEYGWRMTVLIISGILLNGLPCGLLLVLSKTTSTRKDNSQPGQEKNVIQCEDRAKNALKSIFLVLKYMIQENVRLLKNGRCFFITASSLFMGLAFLIPYSLLPDQVTQSGISKVDASWLVSSIGICNIIGRFIFGWLGDKPFFNIKVVFEIMIVLQGILISLMPPLSTFETKLVVMCMFGLSFGGYNLLLPLVLTDEFGPEKIGKSFGLTMFVVGVSVFIGTPIAGWIYDVSHNYNLSFYLGGVECGLAAICVFIPRVMSTFKGRERLIIKTTYL